jgi:parallel beta-helix repeat protein
VTITGNTVSNWVDQGISVICASSGADTSLIENNYVYSGEDTGFSQFGQAPASEALMLRNLHDGSIIKANTVHNANWGIRTRYLDKATIVNNVLYSNYIAGISIRESDDTVIQSNWSYNNDGVGVGGYNNTNLVLAGNFIVSNGLGEPVIVEENMTLGTQNYLASDGIGGKGDGDPFEDDRVRLSSDSIYSHTKSYFDDMFLHIDSGPAQPRSVELNAYNEHGSYQNQLAVIINEYVSHQWIVPPNEGDLYHITRQPNSGIRFYDSEGAVVIRDNTVRNNDGFGVSFADNMLGTVNVSNNIIASNSFTGISIGVARATTTNDGKFFIGDSIGVNYIRNNGYGGSVGDKLTGGIGVTDFAGELTINNNVMYSNNYAGIQSFDVDASGYSLVNNQITSNKFAGIAFNTISAGATIGPNNTIMYNGDPNGDPGAGSGSLENCVITAGEGGNVRGGILVRDLSPGEEMTVLCTNTIETNYFKDVAQTGPGTVYSCGNAITRFFASAADTKYYYESVTVNHNCGGSVINAEGKPFGIVILGSDSDVTVQNCTIKNAAMNPDSWAETGDGSVIGAGIFISNRAPAYIFSNYIYSNSWGVLEDASIGTASAGIMMRCGVENTSIVNNTIVSNRNDGLAGRETGGLIGAVNLGNTFRNNQRGGIGLYDGTTQNLEVAYNVIFSNKRGIGAIDFDGAMFTIANNYIYSNQGNNTYVGGGIRFNNLTGNVTIDNNLIDNNVDTVVGGMGFTLGNGNITIINNTVRNNTGSTVIGNGSGGIGFASGTNVITIANNRIYSNTGTAGIGVAGGHQLTVNNNNTIWNNSGVAIGFGNGSPAFTGFALIDGNTVHNNDGDQTIQFGASGIGGVSLNDAEVSITNNYIYSHIGSGNNEKTAIAFTLSNFSTIPLYISDNTMVSNSSASIGIADCNDGDIIIVNNTMYNGIALANIADSVSIDNNMMYGTAKRLSAQGGVTLSGAILSDWNNAITITNNYIDGQNVARSGVMAKFSAGQDGFELANNTIKNNQKHAIMAGYSHYSPPVAVVPGNIHDNLIFNSQRGIAVSNPNNLSIYNNRLYSIGSGVRGDTDHAGGWCASRSCHGGDADTAAPDAAIAMARYDALGTPPPLSAHNCLAFW